MKTYVVRIDVPVDASSEDEARYLVMDHANKIPELNGEVLELETVLADGQ